MYSDAGHTRQDPSTDPPVNRYTQNNSKNGNNRNGNNRTGFERRGRGGGGMAKDMATPTEHTSNLNYGKAPQREGTPNSIFRFCPLFFFSSVLHSHMPHGAYDVTRVICETLPFFRCISWRGFHCGRHASFPVAVHANRTELNRPISRNTFLFFVHASVKNQKKLVSMTGDGFPTRLTRTGGFPLLECQCYKEGLCP